MKNEKYFECDENWMQLFAGNLIYWDLVQKVGQENVENFEDNPTVIFKDTEGKTYVVVPLGLMFDQQVTAEMLTSADAKALYNDLKGTAELLIFPVHLNLKRKGPGKYYINNINNLKFAFESPIHVVSEDQLVQLANGANIN